MAFGQIWDPNRGSVGALLATNNNLTATTDPLVTSDSSQGYGPGSVWINNAAGAMRWWECLSAGLGAAVWIFSGAAYGAGGAAPNSEVVQFGSSSGLLAAEGNINRQVLGAGVSPAATGSDYVVAVYSLPANAFDISGRGITITACGSFAANGDTKTLKLIFNPSAAVVGSVVTGGTSICTTGAVTTNGGGWQLQGSIFKYGAAGSNTQLGLHDQAQAGAAVSSMLAPTLLTAVESGTILMAVTANCATATGDIVFNYLEVNAMN